MGFLGPDIARPVLPLIGRQYFDRGYALEESLRQRLPKEHSGDLLSDWAARAGHRFPAFLFNTTVVETGQPMAFTTTQLPSQAYRRSLDAGLKESPRVESTAMGPVIQSSGTLYGLTSNGDQVSGFDVQVVTAARLSATFPYVSPAARPAWPKNAEQWEEGKRRGFHLVDGGYYDVYGLVALSQWLDDALQSASRTPQRVTILVIRDEVTKPGMTADSWSWVRQTLAPPSAFLATRSYAPVGGRYRKYTPAPG